MSLSHYASPTASLTCTLFFDRAAYSIREVAVMFDYDQRTVWTWFASDGLPVRMLSMQLRRVCRHDLVPWLSQRPSLKPALDVLTAPAPIGSILSRLAWRRTEAAHALGISARHVFNLEREFDFPVVRDEARHPRIFQTDVITWLNSRPLLAPKAVQTTMVS